MSTRRKRKGKPPTGVPSPLDFFGRLNWIDGRSLLSVIDRYRAAIFADVLWSFDGDGNPRYNVALLGRAKKNWKTADLCLAALYRFLVWPSPLGNDAYIVASDEGQAADDLKLIKRLIAANPVLEREVEVQAKQVVRRDGGGALAILPAQDVAGSHGKTFVFCGFDELHTARNWDLLEALALDPTRPDALWWITSYASVYNTRGAPLYDLTATAKARSDARLYFSWYSATFTTDARAPDDPEKRANPSMKSWPDGRGYLDQQRARLPSHKYRRLHLNLPGLPDGAAFDAVAIEDCTVTGRRRLAPDADQVYRGFVDMSGGSNDDATLAIAHRDEATGKAVVDLAETQAGKPPFNPRAAVRKFTAILREYGVGHVTGDRYAGETFARDFSDHGIGYSSAPHPKSALYEALEPRLNAGEVELPDVPKLTEQLLGLVWRGAKIDHAPGEHDDLANAVAGAVHLVAASIPWANLPCFMNELPYSGMILRGLDPADPRNPAILPRDGDFWEGDAGMSDGGPPAVRWEAIR